MGRNMVVNVREWCSAKDKEGNVGMHRVYVLQAVDYTTADSIFSICKPQDHLFDWVDTPETCHGSQA